MKNFDKDSVAYISQTDWNNLVAEVGKDEVVRALRGMNIERGMAPDAWKIVPDEVAASVPPADDPYKH